MSNLVFDSYNVEFLLFLGYCWPITADVFRILYSPYRQLSLDVQFSIALYMALYSNIKFSAFWSFWPILANQGHLGPFLYLNSPCRQLSFEMPVCLFNSFTTMIILAQNRRNLR